MWCSVYSAHSEVCHFIVCCPASSTHAHLLCLHLIFLGHSVSIFTCQTAVERNLLIMIKLYCILPKYFYTPNSGDLDFENDVTICNNHILFILCTLKLMLQSCYLHPLYFESHVTITLSSSFVL